MRRCLYLYAVFLTSLLAVACGGGSSSNPQPAASPSPNPSPTQGSYNGIPYDQLGDPPGLTNYPQAYFPTYVSSPATFSGLKIAYGRNNESQMANLTAYVTMNKHICSATPVYYNPALQSSFLIGAAHCFMPNKAATESANSSDLYPLAELAVSYGTGQNSQWQATYPVQAIYIMQNYCQGSIFSGVGNCPNFDPSSIAGGQGNDLAVIQISGVYGVPESYPQLESAAAYPAAYSLAPVLSLGYGLNTQTPAGNDQNLPRNTMFYVANYFYQYSSYAESNGYNYLYNSYYNFGSFNQTGYTALVCGGDSGGGDIFWTGVKWILLSEHTYGPADQCGTFFPYLPNAATNVSSYYDWIESIIKDSGVPGPITDCKSGVIANCITNG